MEPQRRTQEQGCKGQSRETLAERIGANQPSPAQEACLLTQLNGLGLGTEALALEVRSQGEDWGWLGEHSLKGASESQLAGKESGKSLDLPKRQKSIVSACVRRGDSEHRLNKLEK